VLGVVIAVNAVGLLLYPWATDVRNLPVPKGFYLTNTLIVVLLIGAGTWWEMARLREGGEVVARMAGARAVDPGTRDLLDRRLLNVVEEMALASGTPVPRVYVMDNETSINAFAAGHSINDAVIAVTRGTLTRLTRDELQGVIGHEFSHILNGDMQLNLRLLGVLFGLLMVSMFGRFMMEMGRGSRSDRGAGPILIAGIALWMIGYIGVLFGRLIKAGVSRNREYLADASSVQFTRNPDGIGGALRKIGWLSYESGLGTHIAHPNAETLSHLFLGASRRTFAHGLFATHPPLEDRIERIYGRELDMLPAPEQPVALAMSAARAAQGDALPPLEFVSALQPVPAQEALPAGSTNRVSAGAVGARPAGAGSARAGAVDAGAVGSRSTATQPSGASPVGALLSSPGNGDALSAAIGSVQSQPATTSGLELAIRAAGLDPVLADSTHAQLLVHALVIDKASDAGGAQRQLIAEALGASAAQQVDALHERLRALDPGVRLTLLDRAMPALRKLPAGAQNQVLELAHALIAADGRVTLQEFLLFTVLRRRLGPLAHRAVPVRYRSLSELSADAALVLSLIASLRLPDNPERAFNAGLLKLPFVDATPTPRERIALDAVSDALDRLNQLAPLAKPALIKACSAAAFVDGSTNWKAASCLRTLCTALDAPLPPQAASS
jgi:Zn-dependent protease with chaperone function